MKKSYLPMIPALFAIVAVVVGVRFGFVTDILWCLVIGIVAGACCFSFKDVRLGNFFSSTISCLGLLVVTGRRWNTGWGPIPTIIAIIEMCLIVAAVSSIFFVVRDMKRADNVLG